MSGTDCEESKRERTNSLSERTFANTVNDSIDTSYSGASDNGRYLQIIQ